MGSSNASWGFRLLVGVLTVCFFPSHSIAQRQLSEEAILFNALRPSVFNVYSDKGKGCGFLVDPAGLVVTNAHVLGTTDHLRVQLDDTTKVAADVVAIAVDDDLAILRIHPAVCAGRVPLPLPEDFTDYALVGERVFAIGSPLNQDRVLTRGIVSGIEDRAILTDVAMASGHSGGPLLNLAGTVIGINTFRDAGPRGPGVSGSISAKLLIRPLENARRDIAGQPSPSSKRYPVMPRDMYPIDMLKASARYHWDKSPYSVSQLVETGAFNVQVITPPYLYSVRKWDDVLLAREARKRQWAEGSDHSRLYDPFDDLYTWLEYAGGLTPTVTVKVAPRIGETTESTIVNLLGAFSSGITGTTYREHRVYEFKADLAEVELVRNGQTVEDLQRGVSWMPLDLNTVGASGLDMARGAVCVYDPKLFEPDDGVWPTVELILRRSDEARPTRCLLPRQTLERVVKDFEHYQWLKENESAELVVSGGVN